MKKIVLSFYLSLFIFGTTLLSFTGYAEMNIPWANSVTYGSDAPINNILWVKDEDLRTGNVNMDSIPGVIITVINVLLGVAGTVAVVALIYYAVQMQINSGITGDSSKVSDATKWMRWALIGFVVAILAWFIVIRFVEILSSVS